MALHSGERLGPYEILCTAGTGGMGEVYRARDTRLDRTVAIKVLPEHFSQNADLKQRFEREARVISSLNHPNICHLYDVGHQEGIDYLVMEYIEGETLALRLAKGLLPIEQVLKIGTEIADALNKAHRQGIVHRDLKPGNIMLTKSGAKLVDFGLARPAGAMKAASSFTGVAVTQASLVSPITQQGHIVGTFQYMSPEQVEGKDADARSDIFALGTVLYEMATGKRAFEGKSAISVASAILEKDPEPISKVQPLAPPALEHVVQRALAKEPDERWQTAADLRAELCWISRGGSQVAASPSVVRRKRRELLGLVAVLALLVVAAVGYYLVYREHSKALRIAIRTSIEQPEKQKFAFTGDGGGPPAISSDGTRIVFAALDNAGKQHLWLRPLDSLTAQLIPGTENATFPFWSQDSRKIAFFADGNLKAVDLYGGPALVVCPAPLGRGGSWSQDDVILFSPNFRSGLYTVSPAGGTPTLLIDQKDTPYSSLRWPQFLPDGKHFIFLGVQHEKAEESTLLIASVNEPKPRPIMTATAAARYASGRLLFLRGTTLMSQTFDASIGKVSGEPAPVADQVLFDVGIWRGVFDASSTGELIYEQGSAMAATRLAWFDRSGKQISTVEVPTGYQSMALSRDGRYLAVQGNPGSDLWSYNLTRGVHTRLTFDPRIHSFPAWSPDNKWVAYVSAKNGENGILRKLADGSGVEEPLILSSKNKILSDWSADGKYILFLQPNDDNRGNGIWAMPLDGDRKSFPLVQTPFNNSNPTFSPDSKWIAYGSDESGRNEIYVVSFPKPTGKWQVSLEGGQNPQWSSKGKEIFFLTSTDNRLMSAQFGGKGDQFVVGNVKSYFMLSGTVAIQPWFAPAPDGNKFIAPAPTGENQPPLTLITNWTAEPIK
jgi:Tol biopolymer transport system component/tRNA A-37 threonylcarbamoyl transferase component Bud32